MFHSCFPHCKNPPYPNSVNVNQVQWLCRYQCKAIVLIHALKTTSVQEALLRPLNLVNSRTLLCGYGIGSGGGVQLRFHTSGDGGVRRGDGRPRVHSSAQGVEACSPLSAERFQEGFGAKETRVKGVSLLFPSLQEPAVSEV